MPVKLTIWLAMRIVLSNFCVLQMRLMLIVSLRWTYLRIFFGNTVHRIRLPIDIAWQRASYLTLGGEPLRRLAIRLMTNDKNAAETWIAAAYANLNGAQNASGSLRNPNTQIERALLFANRALELEPRNAHAHFLKASILMHSVRRNCISSCSSARTTASNLGETLALLNEARRIAPHYFDFQQAVIELHIMRAEFVIAKRRCRDELMAKFGTNARTLTTQALVLKAAAQYAALHKEAGGDGENAATLFDRALSAAQRAVELAGPNICISTILVFSELLIAKRNYERAISFLRNHIDQVREFGRVMRVSDPELAALYEQIGCAYLESERYTEAQAAFESCLMLDASRKRASLRKRQVEAEMERRIKLRRTGFNGPGASSLTASPLMMRFSTSALRGAAGSSSCQQHASTQTLTHGAPPGTSSNSTPAPAPTAPTSATPQVSPSSSPAILNTVTPAAQAPLSRPPPLDALASAGESNDMSSMFGATLNGGLLTSSVSVFLTDDEPTNDAGEELPASAVGNNSNVPGTASSRPTRIDVHASSVAQPQGTFSLNEQLGELDEQADADADAEWYTGGGADDDEDEAPPNESDVDEYLSDQFNVDNLDDDVAGDNDQMMMAVDEGNQTETTADASAVTDMFTESQHPTQDADDPANTGH